MAELVALLRAVNVGGRKLPMAELRELAAGIGFGDPRTYIQSGNLVFSSGLAPAEAAAALERAIADRFGFEAPAIVRTAAEWRAHVDANPFAGDEAVLPRMLHLIVSAAAPPREAADALAARADAGERVRIAGGALWIDFGGSVARSRLTPAAIDRALGSPATARNLNTAHTLLAMLEDREP